jgi:hypothetical protein
MIDNRLVSLRSILQKKLVSIHEKLCEQSVCTIHQVSAKCVIEVSKNVSPIQPTIAFCQLPTAIRVKYPYFTIIDTKADWYESFLFTGNRSETIEQQNVFTGRQQKDTYPRCIAIEIARSKTE